MIAAAVAEGWAVSIPDHEGLHGMWGAPYEPGYRVLDGIRAALSCERLDLSADAPIGLWGYSGGGLASAWAAEMCATYAPELDIVGAVLGSPVGDLGHTFAGSTAVCSPVCRRWWWPRSRTSIPIWTASSKSTPTTRAAPCSIRWKTMTTVEAVIRMARKNMGDYLDEPLEDILATPEVSRVFNSIKLGAAVPTPPVLIVQAVHDYLIDVHDIDELADAYSAGGANVTYHRDAFNEHMLLHPLSAPMALRWLTDRFDAPTADRAPDQDHMADDVQPGDLRRHGAAGHDRGQGHHR